MRILFMCKENKNDNFIQQVFSSVSVSAGLSQEYHDACVCYHWCWSRHYDVEPGCAAPYLQAEEWKSDMAEKTNLNKVNFVFFCTEKVFL